MTRLLLLALLCATSAHAQTIYVDASATGDGTGTSWANAYPELRAALAAAPAGAEVRVAEGVYTPSPFARTLAFQPREGVAVLGGFPRGGAPLASRDPSRFPTVLSGDLGRNDGPDGAGIAENAYHVVSFAGSVTRATRLDGLTITAGNADAAPGPLPSNDSGGGLSCYTADPPATATCSPTLVGVRFVGNRARRGGAVALVDRAAFRNIEPLFSGVTFEGNSASVLGGAVFNQGGEPTFSQTTFAGNTAPDGGAVAVKTDIGITSAAFAEVRFSGNVATASGGAIWASGPNVSAVVLTGVRVLFEGNRAETGGALYADTDNGGSVTATYVDARFVGNVAGGLGGAAYAYSNDGSTASGTAFSFVNALFSGNAARVGSALYALADDSATRFTATQATFTQNQGTAVFARSTRPAETTARIAIANSILWGDGAEVGLDGGALSVNRALVAGGCPAGAACTAVQNADPLFTDADGPDDVPGTPDDRPALAPASPARDAGSAALLPPDTFDLDGDGDTTEPLPYDLDGATRTAGAAPDIGAFEGGLAPAAQITPLAPAVLPPAGGAVAYRTTVSNPTPDPVAAQVWVETVGPSGAVTLVAGPEPLALAPGATTGAVARTLTLPADAPPGLYTVRLRVGTYPGAVLAASAFTVEKSALAQLTVTVTTDRDEYDGLFGTSNVGCSIREALETVNRGAPFGGCATEGVGGPALVTVPAGLYLLTRSTRGGVDNRDFDLDLNVPARIVGAGAQSTYISAGGFDGSTDRVLDVHGPPANGAGMAVEIVGITLRDGRGGPGGGLRALDVDLTLTDVAITGNEGADGGGLFHANGALALVRTVIAGNVSRGGFSVTDDEPAGAGGAGGGLFHTDGPVTITDSVIRGNTAGPGGAVLDDDGRAGDGGDGGGLYLRASRPVLIAGTTVAGNTAGRGGSASDGQTGYGGDGGGLALRTSGPLTLRGSRITGNTTGAGGGALKSDVDGAGGRSGLGGGLYVIDAVSEMTDVEVSGNATGAGGGGRDASAGSSNSGGGLALVGGAVRMTRLLVAENATGPGGELFDSNNTIQSSGGSGAGGGLYASGLSALEITDATFSGNRTGLPGASSNGNVRAPGPGGGLYVRNALTLAGVTITQNAVPAGATGGGLVTVGSTGFRQVANTVVAGNRVGDALGAPTADCDVAFLNDAGFNVVAPGCPATNATTRVVQPAVVFTTVLDAALADTGGPTRTHALLAGSPAIDIGGACGPTDQRGFEAPVGGACDAGAVERGSTGGPVAGEATAEAAFGLGAPYPNPSRGMATVPFALTAAGRVRISVVDVLGREVLVLTDGDASAGPHAVVVPRSALPAGRYTVRLVSAEGTRAAALTVVRSAGSSQPSARRSSRGSSKEQEP